MRYPLSALSLGILALTASPASAQPLSLIPGDVNGDGIVNSQDLAIISASWGSNYGPADLNGDGIVNSQDLAIVSSDWMKKGPDTGTGGRFSWAAAGQRLYHRLKRS